MQVYNHKRRAENRAYDQKKLTKVRWHKHLKKLLNLLISENGLL